MKTAGDIMTPNPACCAPDAPLGAVARLMVQHDCGEVVDDDERCIGIVAQADLAWAGPQKDVAVLVREVSRDTDVPSR